MIIRAFTLFFLILFCAVGIMSIQSIDKEKTFDITNTAIHNSLTNASKNFQVNPDATGVEDIIINIVYKVVDMMLYVTEQLTRLAIKLAVENPQINFLLILKLIMWMLILMIIVPLFKLSVLIFILVQDFFSYRREKKEIKRLKELRK